MAFINQSLIQKFWFAESTIGDVIKSYGLNPHEKTPLNSQIEKVLIKSKVNYFKGYAFIFRENIDKQIQKMIDNNNKNV